MILLALMRIIVISILFTTICIIGLIFCILNPRNPKNAAKIAYWFSYMIPIIGIKIKIRKPLKTNIPQNCIFISNHQNNYDMIIASYIVQPRTITIGKKSIILIPIFGLLYWLSGNLLIDRKNTTKSYNKLLKIAKNIKKKNISIWIFPEGTRNYGNNLLSFKTGAFYTAITANVPIVPICVSNTTNKIKLNKWDNGLVIIDILEPIETKKYNKKHIRFITKYCRNLMKKKLQEINKEK